MYRVFSNLHHFGLYNSLQLLFEKRLGGYLYRPIGTEWLDKGYWKMAQIYNNHPATVAQYLGIRPDYQRETDYWLVLDPAHEFFQKAISLDDFFKIDIDIVIASIPEHIESLKRLAHDHPKKPKVIYQVGNAWTLQSGMAPNIMASAIVNNVPDNINFIIYHQEFDLNVFKWDYSYPDKKVYSFINCLNTASIYERDWQLFQDIERGMMGWEWRSFGGSCRDGRADGIKDLAKKTTEARFIWQVKWGGDGYGHVLFNSQAIGRPTIAKKSYYAGKLGERMMIDGDTCIDIDGLNLHEIINKIIYYSEKNRYLRMVERCRWNFNHEVNFDNEELLIRDFLKRLR